MGLAVAVAAVFTVGGVNPWNNVVLLSYFADPFFGLMVVAGLTYLALWLLLPVRSEAKHRGRLAVRISVVLIAVAGLFGFGLYGTHFYDYTGQEVVRSPDGERALAIVVRSGAPDPRIHLYEGSGLATVDVADLGPLCPGNDMSFADDTTVLIRNSYGEFSIRLDSASGMPTEVMATCSDLAANPG
ncbi:hypothetical protein FB566_4806 [Stackebrandtia endophytica]|uniref:Uncharacterized protein n=1 Tax=Stackebrandtia endophytica TaxID=1496996 RepID=A0A543B2Y9_9ACTN|nr:hypothetical protein FB566_4806 [Stackebrandtia endophytica]